MSKKKKDDKNEVASEALSTEVTVFKPNLVETDVRIIGDSQAISQVVLLLAYIRHALRNNLRTKIEVEVGKDIANVDFAFDVNQQEIKDYLTKESITIS